MSITDAVHALQREMEEAYIRPETGLGTELFLFSSTLAPVVNVDLLVVNPAGQVLLSWRNDAHCGTGWHIPGGCIRYRETLRERIQETAQEEIGCEVRDYPEVLHVFEIIDEGKRKLADQRERAHFITLVAACRLPEDYDLATQPKKLGEPGYLQWFAALPDDLLPLQQCYRLQWDTIKDKMRRIEKNAEMGK